MTKNRGCHLRGSLALRKVPDAIQQHALISGGEPAFLPLSLFRRDAAVIATLDHQGRGGQHLNPVKFFLQLIVCGFRFFPPHPARTIVAQGDSSPVGVGEALRRLDELCFFKPIWRTPGIPLNAREADGVFLYLCCALVRALKPLIPEAARLLERRCLRNSGWLKRDGQGGYGGNSFGKESCHSVGRARTPVVTDDGESLQSQRIGQIDGVLRQSDSRPYPRNVGGEEPCGSGTTKVWRYRAPTFLMESGGNLIP